MIKLFTPNHGIMWIAKGFLLVVFAVVGLQQLAVAQDAGKIEFRGETLFQEYQTQVTLQHSYVGWIPSSQNTSEGNSQPADVNTDFANTNSDGYKPAEGVNGYSANEQESGFSIQLPGSSNGNNPMRGPYNMQGREGSGIWLLATVSATLMLTGALILANQYRGGGESTGQSELPEPPGRP